MAKETKFIQVKPHQVEATIDMWQNFGWELMGAPQEIKTQDVQVFDYQSNDGTKYYKTTKGEHYTKITFQRDKSMPNYDQIVALENAYYSNPERPSKPVEPVYKSPARLSVFFIILAIAGIVLFFVANYNIIFIGIGGLFILLNVIKILTYNSRHAKLKAEFDNATDEYKKNCEIYSKNLEAYEEAVKNKNEALGRAQALMG
ncbi:MAG: hypothetical protein FWD36_08440 [Treponema sp.]|nr:hypothetical protein [Treponema sp.]